MVKTKPMQLDDETRLRLWLDEWRLALALDDAVESSPALPRIAAAAMDHPEALRYDRAPVQKQPACGDIRLVRAGVTQGSHSRPVFVLLVEPASDGAWRALPFGRFLHPACPGEWATGLPTKGLQVLCLWNAACLDTSQLRQTWLVGHMSASRLKTVWALDREWRAGRIPPTPPSRGYLGPPLWHPADPRHLYLAEERDILAPGAVCEDASSAIYTIHDGPLDMAAENGEAP